MEERKKEGRKKRLYLDSYNDVTFLPLPAEKHGSCTHSVPEASQTMTSSQHRYPHRGLRFIKNTQVHVRNATLAT